LCTQTKRTVGLLIYFSFLFSFGEFIKLVRASPKSAPRICAAIKGITEVGAIPAKVSESVLATVTTGFAKLVDEVKKYAAEI
jgi:hypothetical protein